MKIAIIYIGIGRYVCLWDDFYSSCEKYFLPGIEKEYYFFSDQDVETAGNVHLIYEENKGWPRVALDRYKMILSIEDHLRKFDYAFFFNGNTLFLDYITPEEFLPDVKGERITTLVWEGNDNRPLSECPFERNPGSAAYVSPDEGEHYYQSGILGGVVSDYLGLQEECKRQVDSDDSRGVSAIWQDESHLNRFMLGKSSRILGSRYGRPEHRKHPSDPKIIFRDKDRIFGKKYMKSLKSKKSRGSLLSRLLRKMKG